MAVCGRSIRRAVSLALVGLMAAGTAWAVQAAVGSPPAPAELMSPLMYRYEPDTSTGFRGIQPYDPVSLSEDGLSVGMASTDFSERPAPGPQPRALLDERTMFYAVADTTPDSFTRDLRLLDVPGRVLQHPGDSHLSADGLTFVATYAAFGDTLGDCSANWLDPSGGSQYWFSQVVRWQRSDRNSEFGDPDLVSVADPTECDGEPADGGPDQMGQGGDSDSSSPSVSEDGDVVAFASFADNFGPGNVTTNDVTGLYVSEDDGINGFEVSMVTPAGLDGSVRAPDISGDGNRIVFVSDATNLITGVTPPIGGDLVYLAERDTPVDPWTFEVVSKSTSGDLASLDGDGATHGDPSIDGDGERVAFTSTADNLDPSVTMPSTGPVLAIRDLSAPATAVVTNGRAPSGGLLEAQEMGDDSFGAHISHDGERIAATALVDGDGGFDKVRVVKVDSALSSDPDDRRDARIVSRMIRNGVTRAPAVVEGQGGSDVDLGAYVVAFPLDGRPSSMFEGGWALYLLGGEPLGDDIAVGWHGDPVDTATGSFRQDETDLAAPAGAGPAAITRSHLTVGEAGGVFGLGWTSPFDEALEVDGDTASLVTQTGRRIVFTDPGSGPWRTEDGTRLTLTDDGVGGWVVTDLAGGTRSFDGAGRITGWAIPGQPSIDVGWGDLAPATMTSASGYTVTFEDWAYEPWWDEVTEEWTWVEAPYPDGFVDRVTSSDGRQVDYTYLYDQESFHWTKLVGVSRPHAVGQAAGTFGVRTYEWDGPWVSRIVDQVDDTRTKVVVDNTYDERGRVAYQVNDTGDELLFLYGKKPDPFGVPVDEPGFTTVVNAASGDVTVYEYNDRGEVVGITDATGHELSHSWATDRPEETTSRSGVTTDQVYDDAGRLVEVTQTAGATTRTVQEITYLVPDSSPSALTDSRVETVTDEAGVTTTYTYDGAATEPETVSVPCDPDSTDPSTPCPPSGLATTTYTYHSGGLAGLVASVTDPDGVVTEYAYTADRQIETVTSYDGATPLVTSYATIRAGDPAWTETNPAAVEVRTTETPLGLVTTEVYDAEGRLIETRDPLFDGVTHLATVYTYSLDGELVAVTDPAGDVTTSTVARAGDPGWSEDLAIAEVATVTGPDGVSSITKIDRSGDVVVEQVGDPTVPGELATTTNVYGPLGRLESTTDPMGVTTTFEYDVEGRLKATVDEDGERTETAYDDFGRSTVVTDQLGQTTTTTYNALGQVASVEDREGEDTTFTYDDAGRPHTTTDARGGVTETLYTPAGRIAAKIDATNRATTYGYDTAGRQVEVASASGAATTTAYDPDGRVLSSTSPEGRISTYTYDDLGRQLTATDPVTGTTTWTYTSSGEVATETDATGGEISYTYDGGRVATVTDPLGRVTTYGYDSRGNRTSRTDALSGVREWTFDLADRLTAETDPLNRDTTYTYDDLGRLETRTDGAGRVETMTYDDAGRVLSSQFGGSVTSYTYDDEGRRTTMSSTVGTTTWTYDEVGNPTAIDEVGSRDLAWTWDLAGRRVEMTLPNGGRQRQVYDADGRLDGVERWNGSSWVDSVGLTLDDDGLVEARDVAGGMDTTWDRDPVTGRVESFTEDLGGTVTTTDYTYDAAGRIETLVDGAGTTTFDYDDAGQLTSADRPGTADDETFAFDELGRRSTSTRGATTTTYAWDAASQLTSRTIGGTVHTYTYDGSGRRTRESWNGGADYRQWGYSGRGEITLVRRVSPSGTDETSRYLRGDGQILSTTTTPAGGSARSTMYTWDTSQGHAQPVWMRIGPTNHVTATYAAGLARLQCASTTVDCEGPVAHDALGSAVETADTEDIVAGDAYTVYGDPGAAVDEAEYGYRSELHTADLVHLRARDYDPESGTFLRPDPLDGVDGTTTVGNPYHYADNDPINKVDPSGLRPVDDELRYEQCSDLMPYVYEGEALWEGGACYIMPAGVDLNSPCFDNGLRQNTADHAYGVLNGILLGQASHVIDNSGVCESGFEVAVGQLVGSALSLGAIARAAKAGGAKVLARIKYRPAGSMWHQNWSVRGFLAEEKVFRKSQLLGRYFPTIDVFQRGTAISIKSMDLTARSYQTTSKITYQLSKYVDELVNYGSKGTSGVNYAGKAVNVPVQAVKRKELLVVVEPGVASGAQRQAIAALAEQAKSRGVKLVVRAVR